MLALSSDGFEHPRLRHRRTELLGPVTYPPSGSSSDEARRSDARSAEWPNAPGPCVMPGCGRSDPRAPLPKSRCASSVSRIGFRSSLEAGGRRREHARRPQCDAHRRGLRVGRSTRSILAGVARIDVPEPTAEMAAEDRRASPSPSPRLPSTYASSGGIDCEFQLFRSIEQAVEFPRSVPQGYENMDDSSSPTFQSVMQRRKARAGRSLELHVRHILRRGRSRRGS